MRLTDIPAEDARAYLRGIIDRSKPREDVTWRVEHHLDLQSARVIWAVGRYLEAYETRGFGVEETEISIRKVRAFIEAKVQELKRQEGEDKVLALRATDLRILAAAELHLDRYCIMSTRGFEPVRGSGSRPK